MEYGIAKEKEMERETVLGRGQWKECRFRERKMDGEPMLGRGRWRINTAREGKEEDRDYAGEGKMEEELKLGEERWRDS
jgi:hypothetical protein